jgi:hypothetical protein
MGISVGDREGQEEEAAPAVALPVWTVRAKGNLKSERTTDHCRRAFTSLLAFGSVSNIFIVGSWLELTNNMTRRRYWQMKHCWSILRLRRGVVAGTTFAIVCLSFGCMMFATRTYRATAVLSVPGLCPGL